MNLDRAIFAFAGIMILASLAGGTSRPGGCC